jgi:hypothetical protein
MPPRKGKKHAKKSGAKNSPAKKSRASARVLGAPPTITIPSTGIPDPPGYVRINPGGVVKFDVTFPPGSNFCHIPFGQITFGQEPVEVLVGVGTIKVGSGN